MEPSGSGGRARLRGAMSRVVDISRDLKEVRAMREKTTAPQPAARQRAPKPGGRAPAPRTLCSSPPETPVDPDETPPGLEIRSQDGERLWFEAESRAGVDGAPAERRLIVFDDNKRRRNVDRLACSASGVLGVFPVTDVVVPRAMLTATVAKLQSMAGWCGVPCAFPSADELPRPGAEARDSESSGGGTPEAETDSDAIVVRAKRECMKCTVLEVQFLRLREQVNVLEAAKEMAAQRTRQLQRICMVNDLPIDVDAMRPGDKPPERPCRKCAEREIRDKKKKGRGAAEAAAAAAAQQAAAAAAEAAADNQQLRAALLKVSERMPARSAALRDDLRFLRRSVREMEQAAASAAAQLQEGVRDLSLRCHDAADRAARANAAMSAAVAERDSQRGEMARLRTEQEEAVEASRSAMRRELAERKRLEREVRASRCDGDGAAAAAATAGWFDEKSGLQMEIKRLQHEVRALKAASERDRLQREEAEQRDSDARAREDTAAQLRTRVAELTQLVADLEGELGREREAKTPDIHFRVESPVCEWPPQLPPQPKEERRPVPTGDVSELLAALEQDLPQLRDRSELRSVVERLQELERGARATLIPPHLRPRQAGDGSEPVVERMYRWDAKRAARWEARRREIRREQSRSLERLCVLLRQEHVRAGGSSGDAVAARMAAHIAAVQRVAKSIAEGDRAIVPSAGAQESWPPPAVGPPGAAVFELPPLASGPMQAMRIAADPAGARHPPPRPQHAAPRLPAFDAAPPPPAVSYSTPVSPAVSPDMSCVSPLRAATEPGSAPDGASPPVPLPASRRRRQGPSAQEQVASSALHALHVA